MIDPGLAAIIAAGVSLILALVSILRSASDTKQAQVRETLRRRADAYVRVLHIVETRGLAIHDQMYNLTERGGDVFDNRIPAFPRRELSMPDRADRAEARALLAAYGTRATRQAFDVWLSHVDAWEQKLADWSLEFDINGPPELTPHDAEPERSAELAARSAFGEAVSREVVGEEPVRRS